MKYEDVVIGMKVRLTADYGELKKDEVYEVFRRQQPIHEIHPYFVLNHDDRPYLAPSCEDFEPFEIPLTEQEIFNDIITKSKWYAGLRTNRGTYHSAQSANRLVKSFRNGTLSPDKIKQIFNKHGWIKPEVQWQKIN